MRGRFDDLTGRHFGALTVLSIHSKVGNNRKWVCRCDCGNECVAYGCNLKQYHTTSCGCVYEETRKVGGAKHVVDMVGKRFGRLLVVRREGNGSSGKVTWMCRCDCGKEKVVKAGSLRSENTTSCGCVQKETMHEIRWNPNLTDEERKTNRNREMAVPGLHLWRKEVYRRDGYTCQACESKSPRRIVAHHKESWQSNKALRLDVNNGAMVCEECHKELHSRYGWGNNTTEQWTDFIRSKQVMRAIV